MVSEAADNGQAVWPDIWSGSQICAFSGLDGPTTWATALEARLLPDRLGLLLELQPSVAVTVRAAVDGVPVEPLRPDGRAGLGRLAVCRVESCGVHAVVDLGDEVGTLDLDLGFSAQDTLGGQVVYRNRGGSEQAVDAFLEIASEALAAVDQGALVCGDLGLSATFSQEVTLRVVDPGEAAAVAGDRARFDALPPAWEGHPAARAGLYRLALTVPAGEDATAQFAVTVGALDTVRPPALAPAPCPLAAPPGEPAWLGGLSPLLRRTRAKALAVLRANVFAPEGNLPRRWIVTQRLRHRNFNTFHAPFLAAGALHLDPQLAHDVLRCALAQQQPSGHIPEQAWPLGQSLDTPPPLLCWGYWRVYQATGDKQLLIDAVARLKDYVKYPLAARLLERSGYARSAGAKFLTWGRGEGSNMDNSPRFDINEPFAAVDLTSYAAAEILCVARIIAEITPEHREAVHLGWMGEELARETQEYFWEPDAAFFVDRYPDGDAVAARTIAGLVPLFCGVATPAQAHSLVERHLTRDGFWSDFPLASVERGDPRCDQNMWRGAAWPGINILIFEGLRRYGFADLAAELGARTLDEIARWYARTGSLWEYYDSTGQRSPAELPRGRRVGALPDYAWTAAAFLMLLDESGRG